MTNRQIIGHIFYGPFFLLFSTSPRYRYATLHSFVFHQITFPRSNEMKITMNCWSGWLSSDPALWEVGRKRWGAVAQPIEQQHELFYVGHLCFKMQDLIHVNATRRSCWRVEIQSTAISNNLSTCRSCPQWGLRWFFQRNPQWGWLWWFCQCRCRGSLKEIRIAWFLFFDQSSDSNSDKDKLIITITAMVMSIIW